MCRGAHVLRKPAHDHGEEESEQRGHGGRQDTRDEGERAGGLLGPRFQKRNECGELGMLAVSDSCGAKMVLGAYRSQVGKDGDDEERDGVEETDETDEDPPRQLFPSDFSLRLVQVLPNLMHVSGLDRISRKTQLTMSFGLGARLIRVPLTRLRRSRLPTMWAYGTAAIEANPYFSALFVSTCWRYCSTAASVR